MDRQEALNLVEKNVKNKNLVKHMLATEAIMRSLANHFGKDADEWGIAGLLHDLDYDETLDKPELHGFKTAETLEGTGISARIVHAILAHADKAPRDSVMDKAIYATDPLTGFLIACALMTPDKKLDSTTIEFALRRFKEKGFARGASREQIAYCEEFGFSLEDFMKLGLQSLRGIATELGL